MAESTSWIKTFFKAVNCISEISIFLAMKIFKIKFTLYYDTVKYLHKFIYNLIYYKFI